MTVLGFSLGLCPPQVLRSAFLSASSPSIRSVRPPCSEARPKKDCLRPSPFFHKRQRLHLMPHRPLAFPRSSLALVLSLSPEGSQDVKANSDPQAPASAEFQIHAPDWSGLSMKDLEVLQTAATALEEIEKERKIDPSELLDQAEVGALSDEIDEKSVVDDPPETESGIPDDMKYYENPDFARLVNWLCNDYVKAVMSEDPEQKANFRTGMRDVRYTFYEQDWLDGQLELFLDSLEMLMDRRRNPKASELVEYYKTIYDGIVDLVR
eukprot:CAMPEP_0196665994 /NCGR_PEP_ID=MMETSP1086-20130531/63399_1 /TAXON_ID=77921 /ORGANISM="Cyanoptyche  gloeocystis , Strain SAG4.97" /LENGTH=265 /DNA_ID=CAMNT_0042003025 /DNA_START=28 /DNA_END=825 /DNA_ORIENTATION=+